MKQQRHRFKILALILFGMFFLLASYGGYSVLTYGNRWFSSKWNPRVRSQKETVIAGDILDVNGVTLATTVDGNRVYQEDEAIRRAVVHLVGDNQGQVSNGVETFQTSYLYGFQTSLPEMIASLFKGETRRGDNVTLTVDSKLCAAIAASFNSYEKTAGKNGAAVVMNYKTGAVLALTSLPSFDPQNITAETLSDAGQPFWNRVTQSVYAPGSSFKVITTEAALTGIDNILDIDIPCTGGLDVDGHAIRDWGNAIHGKLTLKQAFTKSCNNAFALMALDMGDEKLRQTAENFGFNDNFLFRDLVVENSVYPTTNRSNFEIAWSGAGQSAIVASPMHMCMVAASIANGGVMMEPRLLQSVDSYGGINRMKFSSRAYRNALSSEDADTIKAFMRAVVTSGTGSRAAVEGLTICGKTGSAESSLNGESVTHGWFIGFIDSEDMPYAVAVLVESVNDGDGGGSTAAPIAGDIFRYIKNMQTTSAATATDLP